MDTRKIIIGTFGPSARQIGEAARTLIQSPSSKIVVNNRPDPNSNVFGDRPYEGRRQKDYDRGLSYLNELAERRTVINQVFLGGACDPTTWRTDIAIPTLTEAGVAFYDPYVKEWAPECMAIEAKAKAESFVLLFVFDTATRALASLNEAYEFIGEGKQKVVLVMSYVDANLEIAGQTLNMAEAMDINIARAELQGFAAAKGIPVFTSIADAVTECANICLEASKDYYCAAAG